jgi:hypothetical protein
MAAKPMPGKLLGVILLMVLGVIASLATSSWVSAGIEVALIVGVLAGNDGVRNFLRGLAVVQMLWNLTLVTAVASGPTASNSALVVLLAFGLGCPGYLLWALGQADVRDWMFRKNFKLDESPP